MCDQLATDLRTSLHRDPPPRGADAVVAPVAMFFTRPGQEEAVTMEASLTYWHEDSRDDFDVLFPGWAWSWRDAPTPTFDVLAFVTIVYEIECRSDFVYSGESDLLLLEFVYPLGSPPRRAGFSFDGAQAFQLSRLARSAGWESLDRLMRRLVEEARKLQGPDRVAWNIASGIASDWTRQGLWAIVKGRLLSLAIGQAGADRLDVVHAVRTVHSRWPGSPASAEANPLLVGYSPPVDVPTRRKGSLRQFFTRR
jgi:hypothetical protein